jgi:hypothetical protein
MDRSKVREVWDFMERALKNAAVSVKGEIACINTADGALVPVSTATTLVPIGYFCQSMTGDGTTLCRVELFKSVELQEFANDSSTPVTDAMVMAQCYLKDGKTVSGDATGRSNAGRVWAVLTSPNRVMVEFDTTSQ